MFLSKALTIVSVLTLGLATAAHAADKPEDVTLRKALHYVRDAGEKWMSQRGCVSCHQVPSMIWSHQAAADLVGTTGNENLQRWQEWSTNVVNFVKPAQKTDVDHVATKASNIDTMVAMLLAIPAESDGPWRDSFATSLIDEQGDDGSWKACGQLPLQRRPKLETQAVTTLWATYALTLERRSFDQDAAIAFADQIEDPESTEWLAVRLLVADAFADPDTALLRQDLIDRQNKDGGWGWKRGDPSDALGTGYALYALAKTGAATERLTSARKFLVDTQTASGKWIVPGTKSSAKGKPTATANDWGTAWAVIALAELG